MRFLVLGPPTQRKVDKVVTHARKKKHWYRPDDRSDGWLDRIPGNDRRHFCKLDTLRCVFSYTLKPGEKALVVRHLSVSVPGDKYPGIAHVKAIATMFGFSGSNECPVDQLPKSWLVRIKENELIDDNCIVVVEPTDIKP